MRSLLGRSSSILWSNWQNCHTLDPNMTPTLPLMCKVWPFNPAHYLPAIEAWATVINVISVCHRQPVHRVGGCTCVSVPTPEKVHPPGRYTPLLSGTPPGQLHPLGRYTTMEQCMLGDYGPHIRRYPKPTGTTYNLDIPHVDPETSTQRKKSVYNSLNL